ncbi:MAG: cytidine deaminase [Cyclobacteriaceae bacterium]|nr:cytidine deaminase [Cyclobacteriaceae bacterium]MCK5277416.1 cytidine deaminase [Cyclobacteriaceae bacterium]MCK5467585.1 cytidine deaminase [Cyclobacteriaceae bacterium]
MEDKDIGDLIIKAKEVCQNAYAPYSKFRVGCILLSESGKIYSGCNIENISFGLTICAERAAVSKAISIEGQKFRIKKVVIYTPTEAPITPCGACRQVLKEFGDDFEIISTCNSNLVVQKSIDELLPDSPNIKFKK